MSTRPPVARSRRHALVAAALIAAPALCPLPASAATPGIPEDATLVSKASGPQGLPFPANLRVASQNGRYVVLGLGAASGRPAEPTGPEATIESPNGLVIRDRVADTTTPLNYSGEPAITTVGAISNDGKRLLLGTTYPGATGPLAQSFVLLDAETGELSNVGVSSSAPSDSWVVGAFLSADGKSALTYRLSPNGDGAGLVPGGIWRGPVDGDAEKVADVPTDAVPVAASADLNTFIYKRTLAGVPSIERPGTTFTPNLYGIKQGAGAAHVIAEDSESITAVRIPDFGTCGLATAVRQWSAPRLSADGGRAAFSYYRRDENSSIPQTGTSGFVERSVDGVRTQFENYGSFAPTLEALGQSHTVRAKQDVYTKGNPIYYARQFVAADTELISAENGAGAFGPTAPPSRYVYAQPYDLAGLGTASSALSFTADEPVDSDDRVASQKTESCDDPVDPTDPTDPTEPTQPPVAPVGTFGQYAKVTVAARPRASRSLGTVALTATPAGVRSASKLTVSLKVFGMTYWSHTLVGTSQVTLPRPLLFLPQTLETSVTPSPATDASPAETPLVQRTAVRVTTW